MGSEGLFWRKGPVEESLGVGTGPSLSCQGSSKGPLPHAWPWGHVRKVSGKDSMRTCVA